MSAAQLRSAVGELRRTAGDAYADLDDARLLARFAAGDRDALAEIVRRHAGLVRAVCRRASPSDADADDAFQATCLALARSAGQVRWRGSVAGWLHAVARRVCAEAARQRSRRLRHETGAARPESVPDVDPLSELAAMLDAEVERLPEHLRIPLLLCYYEGRPRDEAADAIGCSLRTVDRRLRQARDRLHARLTRRGVSLGAAGVAAVLSPTPTLRADVDMNAILNPTRPHIHSLADAVKPGVGWGWPATVVAVVLTSVGLAGLATSPVAPQETEPEKPVPQEIASAPAAVFGTQKFRLGHGVTSVEYSPDGRHLLTAGQGWGAALWDAETGELVRHLTYDGPDLHAAFSPDGKVIALASRWFQMWLIDAESGERLRLIEEGGRVVAFSPDGKRIAAAARGGRAVILDAATGGVLKEFDPMDEDVIAVAFSPDGKILAAGDWKGAIHTWDLATGTGLARIQHGERNAYGLGGLTFTPDGKEVITYGKDFKARFWDVRTGEETRLIDVTPTFPRSAAITPDGDTIVFGTHGRKVRVYRLNDGSLVREWQGQPHSIASVAVSPDGKTVATATVHGADVRLWDLTSGEEKTASVGHSARVDYLAVPPDGKTILSGDEEKTFLLWDVTTGKTDHRHSWNGTVQGIEAWAVSAADSRLISGYGRATFSGLGEPEFALRLWDAKTGEEVRILGEKQIGYGKRIDALAFSGDGKRAAAMFDWKRMKVYDTGNGREVADVVVSGGDGGTHYPAAPVALSADGRFAAGANGPIVRVWDVKENKEVADPRLDIAVSLMTFSPDGDVLAMAGHTVDDRRQGEIRLWDLRRNRRLRMLSDSPHAVASIAFSPDGSLLAMGRDLLNDEVRVWEVASGREAARLTGARGGAASLAFSPDGRTLYAGTGSSAIVAWQLGR